MRILRGGSVDKLSDVVFELLKYFFEERSSFIPEDVTKENIASIINDTYRSRGLSHQQVDPNVMSTKSIRKLHQMLQNTEPDDFVDQSFIEDTILNAVKSFLCIANIESQNTTTVIYTIIDDDLLPLYPQFRPEDEDEDDEDEIEDEMQVDDDNGYHMYYR